MKKLLTLSLFFASLLSLNAQLSGVYTIDSKESTKKNNFNSLTEASNALRFKGVAGDVTFELAAGFYYEPLVLEGISNDLNFKVTFTNSKGENVNFVNDGLGILISNSENIHVSNIQFTSISTELSSMAILSNASKVTFENNEFLTQESSINHKAVIEVSYSSHNNEFSNNLIKGNSGIEISRLSNNNTILNNHIYFSNLGLSILSSYNTVVESNKIEGNPASQSKGIVLDGSVGEVFIASNELIQVSEGITQTVTYRPTQDKLSGKIVNNVIHAKQNALTLNNNVTNLQIAFNSLTSQNAAAVSITEEIKASVSNVSILANILMNYNHQNIVFVAKKELLGDVDYNNMYSQATQFKANVGNVQIAKLNDWNTMFASHHSISADPLFAELGVNKYMLSDNSPCIDAGPNALSIGVLQDFDGDERNDVSEIGADEFNKLAYDRILMELQLALKK